LAIAVILKLIIPKEYGAFTYSPSERTVAATIYQSLRYKGTHGVESTREDKIDYPSSQKEYSEAEQNHPAVCWFIVIRVDIVADSKVVLG
jgi:hypothetical protein